MPLSWRTTSSGAKMRRNVRHVKERLPDQVEAAMHVEGQIETTEVKRRTPVDKGPLRGSVHLIGPIREGRRIYFIIAAGGPAAPYAYWVHEDPDALHRVGQWKFIESVIVESRPHFPRRIARRIKLSELLR